MKIQTPNLQLNSKNQNNLITTPSTAGTSGAENRTQNVTFKGGFDFATMGLRFLDTNQAWGANFVDLAFMVTPRTAVDFTRGPDAGVETMRREASGTVNHSLIGAYGLLAAGLFATAINGKFGVKANKMFVSNDNLDILGKAWHEQIHTHNAKNPLPGYLDTVLDKVKGFSTEVGVDDGWKSLDKETKGNVARTITEELKNDKLSKDGMNYLKALITRSVGSESKVKLEGAKDVSVETLLDNLHKVTKSFTAEKVKDAFVNTKDFSSNAFIQGLKKLNGKTSILGLGIGALIGCGIQPFNMYLTRKKTGNDGFVGVEGRKPDKTNKFKLMKLAAATAFGAMALRVIGKPSELLSKIQFKGFTPTLNQFKLVYGLTIMSRLISARDKNELRESSIKDTLGFLNWLVLGNFVAKATASGLEKMIKDKDNALLNYNKKENDKTLFNWLTNSSIKTRDEVLHAELKKAGVETVKEGKAIPIKELLKLAAEHAPLAKTKIKYLNLAQVVGYAYSGLVLGVGIPKLNIAITSSIEKKRKARHEHHHQEQPAKVETEKAKV